MDANIFLFHIFILYKWQKNILDLSSALINMWEQFLILFTNDKGMSRQLLSRRKILSASPLLIADASRIFKSPSGILYFEAHY
ncbi:hypothetical protein [Antarcticibacterium flavum]|uniref:hypothetical protein n=1 Tax=Antarcticibacterium flavum TaxID=2058175 RepID=UPI00143CCE86|nr:hypothetical protein [Antarcticibacterium flavum]